MYRVDRIRRSRLLSIFWMFGGAFLATAGSVSAERVQLAEDLLADTPWQVTTTVAVEGKLYPQPGPQSAIPLKVEAAFRYLEKGTAGTGRQAQALRSIRFYEQAGASIRAGNQVSNIDLRDETRLIVATGSDGGVELVSPSGPLRASELDLLRTAGDSLSVRALLPDSAIEPGESWKPANWVPPFFVGIEAVEKSQLTCRLEKLDKQLATIKVTGEIVGAVLGAGARVEIDGQIEFDVAERNWRKLSLVQKEKRSVGAVTPGLDVEARVTVVRAPAPKARRLSASELSGVPLDANEASRLLMFDAPLWNVRFFHDRNWHLLNQNSDSALLRLLEKGELIAQCSVKKLPDAEPGQHVPEEVFQKDIQKTLGKNFREVIQSERVRLREGRYVYRVVVSGTVASRNDKGDEVLAPMQWNYYLVANSDGRQLALVFSVDPELAKVLKERDLSIVGGLEFLKPAAGPTRAASNSR